MQGWEKAESSQGRMLNGGHLDLNSVQFCSDSLEEGLKQTMLNQELIFMGQVIELHRLYRMQIAMTENTKQRGLENYNSHGGVDPNPVNLTNKFRCSKNDLQCSTPGFKQKPLELQFSADEFICQSGKGTPRGFPIESKSSVQDRVTFDLNISLSTDEDISKKEVGLRSLNGRTCGPPPVIIDLEDPNLSFSNNHKDLKVPSDLAVPNSCFKDKHKLERSILDHKHNFQAFSKNRTRHVSHGTTSSRPFNDVGLTSQRETSSKSGFNGDLVTPDASVPRGGIMLDLNKVQLEDLSYFPNSHSGVVNPVATAFSNITEKVSSGSSVVSSVRPNSWGESNVNHCAEIPDVHINNVKVGAAQNFIDITGDKLNRGGKSENKGNIIFIDLDSDSGDELCISEHPKIESLGSTSMLSNVLSCEVEMGEAVVGVEADPKIESVGSTSKLSSVLSCEIEMGEARAEADVEKDSNPVVLSIFGQNLMAAEQLSSHKLSVSSESECMIDHQACSIKTMQSGVNGGDSNFSSSDENQMVDKSAAVAYSGVLGHRSSESPDSCIPCTNSKEAEEDGLVQTAAELLVKLSLQEPANYLDGLAEVNPKDFQGKEHHDRPQSSCDSYEKMMLNAKECGLDDHSVSSNAFDVDISEKKDNKYKLKRGTRMKDFQKDILPSLSTLTRHEIREDITTFECVIKSREYKKMKARMAAAEVDWCKPTRNKRSRTSRK